MPDSPTQWEIQLDRRRFIQGGAATGAAFTSFLAGCSSNGNGSDDSEGGNGNGSDAEEKDRLVVALPAEQSSLDHANQFTSYGAEWVYTHYAGLIKTDYDWENEELVFGIPDLAEEYEYLEEDGEHLVQFTLRDDVTFHNGDPLDAELVKTEADYWFEENTQTGQNLEPYIDQVSIENDQTVNFHFGEDPYAPFEINFAGLLANPYVREDRGAGNFATNPEGGGCGPYKFVDYESGSYIRLERYEDYHEEDIPHFEELEFRIIPEESTRMAQLRTGEIDLDGFLSTTNWLSLQDEGEMTTQTIPASMWGSIIFNHEANEAFADSRVRRALAMAVNREQYNQAIFDGLGNPVGLPTLPESWWSFDELTQTNLYDPERAKELLAEAGYEDGFEMTLQAGSGAWHQTMAQVISSMYGEIGVEVEIDSMEAQTMWTEIAQGEFTAAVSENLGGPDPDHFLYNYAHPEGTWTTITNGWENNIAEENREIFDLIKQQRITRDRDERIEILRDIYPIFAEEMPYHFFVAAPTVVAHQPELEGYWLYPGDYSREALRQVSWEQN